MLAEGHAVVPGPEPRGSIGTTTEVLMASTTPDPVISGVPYTVREVDGGPATGLDDFVGTHDLVVEGRTGAHVLTGQGVRLDGVVHFHEKDAATSKDVRPWRVAADGDGFVAVSGVQ
jgi:hypothetical protein